MTEREQLKILIEFFQQVQGTALERFLHLMLSLTEAYQALRLVGSLRTGTPLPELLALLSDQEVHQCLATMQYAVSMLAELASTFMEQAQAVLHQMESPTPSGGDPQVP